MNYFDVDNNHFEEEEIIKNEYLSVDYSDKKIERGGLNIISDGTRATVIDCDSNTAVVGCTGSKKTRDVIAPYAYSCIKARENIIVNDPKLELYRMLKTSMDDEYEVKIIDFRNPLKSDRYNPFEFFAHLYKKDKGKATIGFAECAESIIKKVHSEKDAFWENSAASMIVGYACLLCDIYDDPAMCNLKNIYQLHIQASDKSNVKSWLDIYDMDKNSKAYEELNAYMNAPHDTRTSMSAVFSEAISKYLMNENINTMVSTDSTFNILDLATKKKKPFAIFISNRDESTVYNPIVTMMIHQFYQQLIELAQENNGILKNRVNFILDEFGTSIGAIPDINSKLGACRSRNIRFLIGIQSLSQLSLIYGKDEANLILQNCNDWVYLYSNDMTLLKIISERCGKQTDSRGFNRSLVSVEKLAHLEKNKSGRTQALFLVGRNYPFFSYLPDIESYNGIRVIDSSNLRMRKVSVSLDKVDFRVIAIERSKKRLKKMMDELGEKGEDSSSFD